MTEVSVVIPTKNEEASIGICIEKVQGVFAEHHIDGEIVVADNSTDGTPEIAKRPGARVVVPDKLGYGNAYRFGFAQASGDYIVMGDADNTYDFTDMSGNFLQKLGKCSISFRDRTSSPERWTFEEGSSRGKIFSAFAFMRYWSWRG